MSSLNGMKVEVVSKVTSVDISSLMGFTSLAQGDLVLSGSCSSTSEGLSFSINVDEYSQTVTCTNGFFSTTIPDSAIPYRPVRIFASSLSGKDRLPGNNYFELEKRGLPFSVTINRAIAETVGTCSFLGAPSYTNLFGFSYRITFSKVIDASTFTLADIVNTGTGGKDDLQWLLTNCGDDRNFKLTAKEVEGNGAVTPVIPAGVVSDFVSGSNTASTSTANTVEFFRGWYQEAYLKAPNAGTGDSFGYSVSIDGETLVVSAKQEDSNLTTITSGSGASFDNSAADSGAVYVYTRSVSSWALQAYIKASNSQSEDYFGDAISLHRNILAVGAYGEDSNQTTITNGFGASSDNSLLNSGAVYVYQRSGSSWTQVAYIKASNGNSLDRFGSSVSVWNDTIAVGASGEDSNQVTITNGTTSSLNNSLTDSGAVYVYRKSASSWIQEAYLKSQYSSSSALYGSAVSLENDTLVVGAPGKLGNTGEVAIFKRSNNSWGEIDTMTAVNRTNSTYYGSTLAFNKDTLVVGSPNEKSTQNTITNGPGASSDVSQPFTGAAYVYRFDGSFWRQEAYIKASNSNGEHFFSSSLAIDGNTLIVGAYGERSNLTTITNGPSASSDNSLTNAGAAYVFQRNGSTWYQQAFIKPSYLDSNDYFGMSVSISGDTIAVGALGEDSDQTTITNGATTSSNNSLADSGAVYIFRNNGLLFDVTDVWGTSTESSVNLHWHRTGGLATHYLVVYQQGSVAPRDCSGSNIYSGPGENMIKSGLSLNTIYSFRVCATDGNQMTTGSTFTIATTSAP